MRTKLEQRDKPTSQNDPLKQKLGFKADQGTHADQLVHRMVEHMSALLYHHQFIFSDAVFLDIKKAPG